LHRSFWTVEEDERHSIASGNPNQFPCRFCNVNLLGICDDLGELFLEFALFVEEQFRVTDHVHEKNVANLQLKLGLRISGHISISPGNYPSYMLSLSANFRWFRQITIGKENTASLTSRTRSTLSRFTLSGNRISGRPD